MSVGPHMTEQEIHAGATDSDAAQGGLVVVFLQMQKNGAAATFLGRRVINPKFYKHII